MRWSFKTISALNQISIQEIQHFKKHYAIKFHDKKTTLEGIWSKQKLKVTQEHIDWVSRFIDKKRFWCFTIKDIKHFLDNELTDYEKISSSTIHRILTQTLKMRYKKAAKFPKKTFLVDNKRKLFESAMVLRWLDNNDYELIYVDEFSI